ncbi:Hypothetical predicted protein [Xyrichtys novacula]|uniref:Uncharacterized protein n=1 Tax=Xyrichtys novacula TaxID=13765 RepID=A0AAV1H9A6_XYRNO|nr:Hypothetical predicted protein [Xyrichtys novacula]
MRAFTVTLNCAAILNYDVVITPGLAGIVRLKPESEIRFQGGLPDEFPTQSLEIQTSEYDWNAA